MSDKCLWGEGVFIKVYMYYFGIESKCQFSLRGPKAQLGEELLCLVTSTTFINFFNRAGGSGGKRKRKPRKEEPTSP